MNKSKDQMYDFDKQLTCLIEQGYSSGLAHAVRQNSSLYPLRIWVVDNSGSMITGDGKRLVETSKRSKVKLVPCSRWAELQECVVYHANMAALMNAPTRFTLLNDAGSQAPQEYGIANGGVDRSSSSVESDVQFLTRSLKQISPSGVTPLARHVDDIYDTVSAFEPKLRQNGQRIVVVLATDGLPTDGTGVPSSNAREIFEHALKRLMCLPVWIVVRLCTNDKSIVSYYEGLDSALEVNLDVLDDFLDEAKEVYMHNPWLCYGLPLHRCREMGFHNQLLDLIDERPLTMDEISDFMCLLCHGMPRVDPMVDWDIFCDNIAIALKSEQKQWNPVKRQMTPWVDINILHRKYGKYSTVYGRIAKMKWIFDDPNWFAKVVIMVIAIYIAWKI
mmetsp:Transcript_29721/g.38870  ORF Transcript_29721/g.38870 Transcript_29721/m.38870 type:complete len:389 (+) Transcript_29721:239-1405(+)|eukprot:CAMPEP_0195262052 /NCGR_PEP_ID=MMETSP0706-20130129/9531_1 /TAXON_ID=33640 /ORGANISM="Asterionellopsis glacialis, Strain CCMP134" /LENGTH=388 /DNA_ID=CAMNT_0040316071 /DNA_START=230 /DNA_END=1396 /DNA_ORIENTATION=+